MLQAITRDPLYRQPQTPTNAGVYSYANDRKFWDLMKNMFCIETEWDEGRKAWSDNWKLKYIFGYRENDQYDRARGNGYDVRYRNPYLTAAKKKTLEKSPGVYFTSPHGDVLQIWYYGNAQELLEEGISYNNNFFSGALYVNSLFDGYFPGLKEYLINEFNKYRIYLEIELLTKEKELNDPIYKKILWKYLNSLPRREIVPFFKAFAKENVSPERRGF